MGSPGTWEAPSPPRQIPAGGTGGLTPGLWPTHSAATGAKLGCNRGTACAKTTKRSGKGGRESERLILPLTRRNRPEGFRRGKVASGHETAGGKDDGDPEP